MFVQLKRDILFSGLDNRLNRKRTRALNPSDQIKLRYLEGDGYSAMSWKGNPCLYRKTANPIAANPKPAADSAKNQSLFRLDCSES